MRMWMVDPAVMCRQHLLGEHVELHMFVGSIRKGVSMQGYVTNRLLESASIQERHDALVAEMRRRGYSHLTPLRYADRLNAGTVDRAASKTELLARCEECCTRARDLA